MATEVFALISFCCLVYAHLFSIFELFSCFTLQIYDMRYELNEIEARREQYPSTISFVNLLNTLIADETDVSDRGRRYGVMRMWCFSCFPSQKSYFSLLMHLFADLLAFSDSYVIMCLDHFPREPIQILVRNGSWLLLVFSTSGCMPSSFILVASS